MDSENNNWGENEKGDNFYNRLPINIALFMHTLLQKPCCRGNKCL